LKDELSFEIIESEPQSNEIPLLFLHGMLGSKEQFSEVRKHFPDRTHILLDLPSHGGSVYAKEELNTRILAESVRDFLIEHQFHQVDIIGYSLGGYVALELAVLDEALTRSIVAHAMKFYWTQEAVEESLGELYPATIQTRSAKGFAALERVHAKNTIERTLSQCRSLVSSFRERHLTSEDIREAGVPLLLSVGDRDELVPMRETQRLYDEVGMELASLAVHANTPHPFHKLPNEAFARSVNIFWKTLENVKLTSF
jgi:pimeloyl-ACP methyl ester carboxylesterase